MTASRTTIIRFAAAAYALALAAASLLPAGTQGPGRWQQAVSPTVQSTLHVPAYAGLALLLACTGRTGRPGALGLAVVALASIAYGALLEFAQTAVPGRMASPMDMALNGVGAAGGVCIAAGWMALRARRAPRPGPGPSRPPAEDWLRRGSSP